MKKKSAKYYFSYSVDSDYRTFEELDYRVDQ